jgi:hypothetical protein
MKNFKLVSGDEKCVKLVKINGTTALAKDAKPSGKLLGIVVGTDDVTEKNTYYLCMETEEGFGIYATGVAREIDKIADLLTEAQANGHDFIIECTTGISRNSGQSFFKIMVRSF